MPKLRWRLDHHGSRDVMVDFNDRATVGEVATALAQAVRSEHSAADRPLRDHGAISLHSEGTTFDATSNVLEAAPRSGSTVRIVPCADSTGEPHPVAPSPVTLRDSTCEGRSDIQLRWGETAIAPGVSIRVDESILIRDDGAGATVNGIAVRGNAALAHGDLLGFGDRSATVTVDGVLRAPPPRGPTVRVPVSRGVCEQTEPEPVSLPNAPGPHRHPGLPWLTALVPLAMALGVWFLTRSLLMVGFMAFSFVYIVASGIEGRVESTAARRFAVSVFRDELEDCSSELDSRRDAQAARDERHHPAAHEVTGWVDPPSHRLWERGGAHRAPLTVRLGTSALPPDDPVTVNGPTPREFRSEVDDVVTSHRRSDRPLVVDLDAFGGLAVIGDDEAAMPLCQAIVSQLSILVPPERLRIETCSSDRRWRWTRWLPHCDANADLVLRVADRTRAPSTDLDTRNPNGDAVTLWRASDSVDLPEALRAVVHIDNFGLATLQLDNDPPIEFALEGLDHHLIEPLARRLCGFEAGPQGGSELPERADPASIGLRAAPEAILDAWRSTESGLRAPLGHVSGGGVLSIDLPVDGPHALVAGTTGAGKSELLRTLLVGIAAQHPPERATFLLVDYKGGAAFGPLATLPHCVGLVTDLGTTEVERTLVSLRAELRRREQVLAKVGESDVLDMDPQARPPALLVVVDEFAALVAEVPEFLDGVIDIAQRGRSLGIHMVLATQRPAGVISDAVRANTSVRIALRLPDADDSLDVVDSPAAAQIPRDRPGRALVRLAHDSLVEVQVAHTAAESGHGPAVAVEALDPLDVNLFPGVRHGARAPHHCAATGHARSAPVRTQLDALVAAISDAHAAGRYVTPERPVPPPLPSHIGTDELAAGSVREASGVERNTSASSIAVGLWDRADLQQRCPLMIDPFASGGFVVIGNSGSGASTTLATVGHQMASDHGCRVVAIDALGGFTDTGTDYLDSVVAGWDHELVRRLLEGLLARLGDGAGHPHLEHPTEGGSTHPRKTLLLVDGFGAFEELQAPVNRGWANDALVALATRGRPHGVTVGVTTRRRSELPPVMANALSERIALRVANTDEASLLDAPPELADPALLPGRCWVRGHWAQIAQISGGGTSAPSAASTFGVPRLAASIDLTDLESSSSADPESRRWCLSIAVDASTMRSACLDLTEAHGLVVGSPRSGVTTTLATIAACAAGRGISVLHLDERSDPDSLNERLDRGGAVVLIDNVERVIEDPTIEKLVDDLLNRPESDQVRIVAGGALTGVLRCYSPTLARLRSMRTGLVLGVDGSSHGDVLHHDLARRDDLPIPAGRGWLTNRCDATVVQVATAKP